MSLWNSAELVVAVNLTALEANGCIVSITEWLDVLTQRMSMNDNDYIRSRKSADITLWVNSKLIRNSRQNI